MIKHIFLDMDGTLLNSQGKISLRTASYLRQVKVPITLVSARAPMEMTFAINELQLHGPQLAFNSGLIFTEEKQERKILFSAPLDPKEARKIVIFIQKHYPELSLSLYTKNRWLSQKIDSGIQYESRITGLEPTITAQFSFTEPIYKIMLIDMNLKLLKQLRQDLHGLALTGTSIKATNPQYVEITNYQAQKKNGVSYIQKRENLSKKQMLAIGDGENDLPMLNQVGHPVAMGNAQDEVKQQAEMITRSNNQDGIVTALKHYLSN